MQAFLRGQEGAVWEVWKHPGRHNGEGHDDNDDDDGNDGDDDDDDDSDQFFGGNREISSLKNWTPLPLIIFLKGIC